MPLNISCAMKDADSNLIRDEILEVAAHISQELLHWSCCPADYQPLWQHPVLPGGSFIFYPVLVWGSHMEACAIQCSQQCWLLWCLLHPTYTPMAEVCPTQRLCYSITCSLTCFIWEAFFPKRKNGIIFSGFLSVFVSSWFGFKSSNITCRKRNCILDWCK